MEDDRISSRHQLLPDLLVLDHRHLRDDALGTDPAHELHPRQNVVVVLADLGDCAVVVVVELGVSHREQARLILGAGGLALALVLVHDVGPRRLVIREAGLRRHADATELGHHLVVAEVGRGNLGERAEDRDDLVSVAVHRVDAQLLLLADQVRLLVADLDPAVLHEPRVAVGLETLVAHHHAVGDEHFQLCSWNGCWL